MDSGIRGICIACRTVLSSIPFEALLKSGILGLCHFHFVIFACSALVCAFASHSFLALDHMLAIWRVSAVHDLAVTASIVIGYFASLCCIARLSSSLDSGVLSLRKKSLNAVKLKALYTFYLCLVKMPFAERCNLTYFECWWKAACFSDL